jgi:chitinase
MKWKLGISKKYAFYVSALSLVLLTVILISVSIIVWREANTLKERLREGVKETYEKSYKTMIINRSRSFSYVIFNSLYRLDINGINHLTKVLHFFRPIIVQGNYREYFV